VAALITARPRRAPEAAPPHRVPPAWLVGAVGAVALLLSYPDALRMPFLNDDYVFLDATARRAWTSLWGFDSLAFDWWRPWSREQHFWLFARVLGPSEPGFHAVGLALAGVVLGLYHALACRLVGASRAALATACVTAMAAWALPVLWVSGCQDLWMLVWALLALHAWGRDRTGLATIAYALALMSKETAAPLPLVFLAWDVAHARRPWPEALRRLAPVAGVALVWASVHPQLGGRFWRGHAPVTAPPEARLPMLERILRSLAMLVSLDRLPAPEGGARPLLLALPGAALLAGLVWATRAHAPPRARGVGAIALAWTVAGGLPLLLPTLGWHAYYGLFGALGAWLWIASRAPTHAPIGATAVVLLTLLGAARADTASTDWGDAHYQRRAARLLRETRDLVREAVPRPAPHTRLWFVGLPDRIGFLQGDGPALRVLYGDPTLRAGYWSEWSPPSGRDVRDRFFRMSPGPRLVEVHPDDADSANARHGSAEWGDDVQALALQWHASGQHAAASELLERVARLRREDAEPAYNLAIVRLALGDSLGAGEWLLEATRRPVRPERLREAARAAGLDVFDGPAPSAP